MLWRVFIPVAVGFAIAFVRAIARGIRFKGNIATLRADDEGLAAAKAQATATLPAFLQRLSAPGVDRATTAVKAPLVVPNGTEHVWLSNIRVEGHEFLGTIDNNPRPETGKRAGDLVRVRQSEISDWKVIENGQLVGGFTIRYFVSRMPAKQRAALIANLPFAIGDEAIPRAA